VRGAGIALLPYYKTILPLINGFKNRSSEMSREIVAIHEPCLNACFPCADGSNGDQIDFANGGDLQTTIAHFLDCLYETGGKAAFSKVRCIQHACIARGGVIHCMRWRTVAI
jgi:hypothetical protein